MVSINFFGYQIFHIKKLLSRLYMLINHTHIKWYKYQNAYLLNQLPAADNSEIDKVAVRKLIICNNALFARWTSHFDCGYETNWWYCIKDKWEDISILNAKQRYRIKKGLNNVDIHVIVGGFKREDDQLASNIFECAVECFADYPEEYRPILQKETFTKWLLSLGKLVDIWVCSDKEIGDVCGYGYCTRQENMVHLSQIKIPTRWLKNEVNAALAYKICEYYLKECGYKYICDGERNIRHQTNYQDFLVRVLNFRYAYCKLNIVYHPLVQLSILILYPFRKFLAKSKNKFIYNIYCLLNQEEIFRTQTIK